MKFFEIKNQEGYVVLLLVIAMSAVSVLLAYNSVILGLGDLNMGYSTSQESASRNLAESCIEETLQQLFNDSNYTNETLTLNDGTCTTTVTEDSGTYTINVTGQNEISVTQIEVEAVKTSGKMQINSWDEK